MARVDEARAAARLAKKNERVKKYEALQRTRGRKLDTRRKIIAGALALEHCRHDSAWAAMFRGLLDEYVVKDAERLLFSLPPLPVEAAPTEKQPSAPGTRGQDPVAPPSVEADDPGIVKASIKAAR